jgi:hypothetical protein
VNLSIFVPDDGYTVTAKIPGTPGLYPPVTVKYRPATPSVRFEYLGAADKADAGARIIARQVQRLTVDGDETPVTLRPEVAMKLHAELFSALLNVCVGFAGPSVEQADPNSGGASGSNAPTPA